MRWLGALALPLLAALAAGAAVTDGGFECPPGCDCADLASIELDCKLPRGGRVLLEGERAHYLNIRCEQNSTELSCEDIPEFDFGRNGTLRNLAFRGCPLASLSVACVARRVRAARVTQLNVEEVPGGLRLEPRHVAGLPGLRQLFLRGGEDTDEEMGIPSEALATVPALERLVVSGARVRLAARALAPLRALAHLELSLAQLRAPPPGALAGLPALTDLSLFRNDIQNITADTFQNLPALEVLDVSVNALRALDGAALAAGCPRLRHLVAFANPLRTLHPLRPLQHLEKLEIFDCDPGRALELSAGALGGLPRLQQVTARSCLVSSLPEDLLAGSAALRALDLRDNALRALPPQLFADQRALAELDLSGNQLEALPPQLFWRLSALQRLNLDNNRLVQLPDRFVEGTALRALSAAGNRLRALGGATFTGARALERLNLSRNQLENSPAGGQYATFGSPFNALLALRELDLSRNALRKLYADLAPALLQLTLLDMSHNNLTYVTDWDNSLNFLSANVTVDLSDNNISTVELSPALWPARASPGYSSRVLLARNPLRCDCRAVELARRLRGFAGAATQPAMDVGDSACADPPSLRGRRLAQVDLYDLACDIPAELCVPNCSCVRHPQTIALDCTEPFADLPPHFNNFPLELKLRYAPSSLHWISPTVQTLDLSDLNLTVVPKDLNISAIKYLDLRGNALTEIPVEILEANVTVKLSRNPLACDCWRAEGVRRLQAAAARALVSDYEEVTCAGGFPVQNVDAARLCHTPPLAVVGAVLALVGLACAAASALLLRYSLPIKVFLYARGWCGCWVREEELDKDKKYDAFVSFAHQDEGFVKDVLKPGLEGGPRPFKLCIHDRDWVAGEWIPAQIAESVEQSRRTVVVVSRNFLDSKWGRLEFRAANMSAEKEKRCRVIVVLLEDVADHGQLDAELKAYLATNTYLKWGDPRFWDKLRYALPHRAEEVRMRKQGGRLARLMQGAEDKSKGGDGPLDVKFTPNGKILTAAIKEPPDGKIPSAMKTPRILAADYV